MDHATRPYRSVLYIPGSKERALDKARTLAVDAIIFDLEDAVAVDEKANARALLAQTLKAGGFGARAKIVRINALDTEWGALDAAAMADVGADAILLPKVDNALDIKPLTDLVGPDLPVWAMIETPRSIVNAMEIAAHPRVAGFVLGTNDLAKDLNCRFRADRLPLMASLQISLLAARAHGVVCIDGVYNAFKDDDGLRAEAEQGRDLGFDGKTLIHPAQVAIANQVFAPSPDEVDLAQRQIDAFEQAEAAGQGVAVVDGRIVENLHVATARATLARAAAIAALELAT
ncbi:MAG: CoA ester lyase [Rhodobacter sp.]|jgi:(3S)-malyl-CoA thioesterase|nr:CoA ester lyase [Rhodobacter sp.]